MRHSRYLVAALFVLLVTMTSPRILAQVMWSQASPGIQILNVESENIPSIENAPFTADATTELTQVLADGNRIERRFTSSIARDSKGRTRREQEMALVGPLFVFQASAVRETVFYGGRGARAGGSPSNAPKFVVITDPVEGATYTLDDTRKEARRMVMRAGQIDELKKVTARLTDARMVDPQRTGGGEKQPTVESLGTRQIEGVTAEGTRSTTTIPAGEIGNLLPINVVTERWFSKELQMPVLITRHDPQSGDTVYRLSSIVKAEPPPDVFTVPGDYERVTTLPVMTMPAGRQGGRGGRGVPEAR